MSIVTIWSVFVNPVTYYIFKPMNFRYLYANWPSQLIDMEQPKNITLKLFNGTVRVYYPQTAPLVIYRDSPRVLPLGNLYGTAQG